MLINGLCKLKNFIKQQNIKRGEQDGKYSIHNLELLSNNANQSKKTKKETKKGDISNDSQIIVVK